MMDMTHYMELLADNQPWNLLIFMAGPVVLAETIAITELYLLFTRKLDGIVRRINSLASIVVAVYFIGIIAYLIPNAVVPITQAGEWRTWIDILAVVSYLLSGLPLIWIGLQDTGLINKSLDSEDKLKVHATCVAVFLILAHVAMIFGMLSPGALSGTEAPMMMMQH